jgi:uncharacterized protein (DUF2225 family)
MIYISQIQHLEKARKFPEGTVLSPEGQNDEMFILLRGSAAVERLGPAGVYVQTERLTPGDYFGEYPLLLGEPSDKRLIATSDVIVLPVQKRSALEFIQKEPYVALSLMTDMTQRAYDAMAAISALQTEHSGQIVQAINPLEPELHTFSDLRPSPESLPRRRDHVGLDIPLTEPRDSLFPPGHEAPHIEVQNDNTALLMEKGYTCPICKHAFRTLRVKKSKLMVERTDPDLRYYYKGVEPLHYDVVTCPSCLYSALEESFTEGRKIKPELTQVLDTFKGSINIGLGMARDSLTIFGGYYLAIICATRCFLRPSLVTSRLLVKLSRLYHDVGDEEMERYVTEQALAAYIDSYEHIDLDATQSQQICVMIAELHAKLGNITEAKQFFYLAKTEINVAPEMTRHADMRLEDMRELESMRGDAGGTGVTI